MIGFGTKDIFGGINSFNHKECLCYYYNSKGIYENGQFVNIPSNMSISNGAELSVKVNRSANTVKWKMNGSQLTEASIPKVMRIKALFLFVIFFNKKDKLELLIAD